MTTLALSAEQQDAVARYGEALRALGQREDHVELWGARSFFARFGSLEGWRQAPLARKMTVNRRVHRFISWLLATRQVASPADYLIARRPILGRVVATRCPDFFRRFRSTALALGFKEHQVRMQWAALCQACTLHACGPEELTPARLDDARSALLAAGGELGHPMRTTASALYHLEATLFHAGVTDHLPRRRQPNEASTREAEWGRIARTAPALRDTAHRYLEQIALSLRPGTVFQTEATLREFAAFVVERDPAVRSLAQVERRHVEAYKSWLAERPKLRGGKMHRHTIRDRLGKLRSFFERTIEWGYEDTPARVPIVNADFPVADEKLPRFIDDAASAKLLIAARAHPDPFTRLTVEFLARTGLRKGEYLRLTVDAVVKIGSAFWLRVPVGKLHNDRYIPLHPQLKELLDAWLARRPKELRSELLFVERGRPVPVSRVDQAVRDVAAAAGIGHLSPHQLRHTLATQAINRGMSLEAIAALLGHRSLNMTMVYAKIADRTVAEEYFAVSKKIEALYDRPPELPADAEGSEMVRLRREMHRRMLGNGWCARPVEMDCHFESICESCSFFVTTLDFKPTLERQRDDAVVKGQVGRVRLFEGLLQRLDGEAAS